VIPHSGHLPPLFSTTSACIGHVYESGGIGVGFCAARRFAASAIGAAAQSWMNDRREVTTPTEPRSIILTAMSRISRREFLGGTGAGLVIAAVPPVGAPATSETSTAAPDAAALRTSIHLIVNGTERRIDVEDRWTLAETLRDRLELTGTKV